tara:strand:- start:238 stop:405 length:168 start_codon:yes stop_codon:yes gene_type:complete
MKLETGSLIQYQSPWEDKSYIGMVTKKTSGGYWVIWSDGQYKILITSLLKYTNQL